MVVSSPGVAVAQESGGGEKNRSLVVALLTFVTLILGLAKAIVEFIKGRSVQDKESSQSLSALQKIENEPAPTIFHCRPRHAVLGWSVVFFILTVYFFGLAFYLVDWTSPQLNLLVSAEETKKGLLGLLGEVLSTGAAALFWGSVVALILLGAASFVFMWQAFSSYTVLKRSTPQKASEASKSAEIMVKEHPHSAIVSCAQSLKTLGWHITKLDSDTGEIRARRKEVTFFLFRQSGQPDEITVQVKQDKNVKQTTIMVECDGVGIRPNFEGNRRRNERRVRQFVDQFVS